MTRTAIRTTGGSMPVDPFWKFVIVDTSNLVAAPGVAWTVGATIINPQQVIPSSSGKFALLGFSTTMQVSYGIDTSVNQNADPAWARLGELWAGVFLNADTTSLTGFTGVPKNGAIFPEDLSTLEKMWSGKDDDNDLRITPGVAVQTPRGDQATLISRRVMFPFPVEVEPFSKIGFGLILTPSLTHQGVNKGCGIIIWTCQFSIIYQQDA